MEEELMKPVDTVGVTFVNAVIGSGTLNNVVNVQFGTYLFTPADDGKSVDGELQVSCRLRMDHACAQQLHNILGRLLESIASVETIPGEEAPAVAKPN